MMAAHVGNRGEVVKALEYVGLWIPFERGLWERVWGVRVCSGWVF
jgi:hypothetical protein